MEECTFWPATNTGLLNVASALRDPVGVRDTFPYHHVDAVLEEGQNGHAKSIAWKARRGNSGDKGSVVTRNQGGGSSGVGGDGGMCRGGSSGDLVPPGAPKSKVD